MLDYFGIFTKGGALLWTLQFTALKHNPVDAVNALIRACLLEERSGEKAFVFHPRGGAAQALKWTFDNGLGLVFVAVYQQTLSLLYVDELLQRVKNAFVKDYKPSVYQYPEFEQTFRKVLKDCEARADEAKRSSAMRTTTTINQGGRMSGGGRTAVRSGGDGNDDEEGDDEAAGESPPNGLANGRGAGLDAGGSDEDGQNGQDKENVGDGAFDVSKLKKGSGTGPRQLPGKRGSRGGKSFKESNGKAKEPTDDKDKPKKGKVNRHWGALGAEENGKLDRSDYNDATNESASGNDSTAEAVDLKQKSTFDKEEDDEYSDDDDEMLEEPEPANGKAQAPDAAPKKKGLLASFMSNIAMGVVGKSALTRADVEPALVDMKRKLMERNVAEEIAQQICDSVASNLEGQKLTSFTGVGSFVRSSVETALNGILNKRTIDVLLDIQKAKAKGRPYVMVFCGVNGVGKSTNLAKITYWLLQHDIKPMIAACDTFRAGAVEQLKTHCQRLKVPLYERGYEKDPAKVAHEAIRQAQRDGRDVVLVDTAGRMQDNEPLMRALSNLIQVNQPNLVLFVGEALVGNDAVDQLVKFNRALADLSAQGAGGRRLIDGIVLTKFDTIDDKVGAALSMVYTSGAPVMFVGCGQTYVDLKKLNVKSVVKSLLK